MTRTAVKEMRSASRALAMALVDLSGKLQKLEDSDEFCIAADAAKLIVCQRS
jgi:hypothetical protein